VKSTLKTENREVSRFQGALRSFGKSAADFVVAPRKRLGVGNYAFALLSPVRLELLASFPKLYLYCALGE
jgi:hypothetical protein